MSLARIVVNSRGESVILDNSLPSPKPKQAPRRKNHFFTYNNYKIEEIGMIVDTLKRFAYKGKIQTEVGHKCKTPHLQGMIWCHEEHRDTEFKLPKQISWRKLLDEDNVADYCGKDDTHDGIFRTSWGFPKPIKILEEKQLYNWQKEIIKIMNEPVHPRHIHWYWEPVGNVGKSEFCKYLVVKYKVGFLSSGKYADLINLAFNINWDITNCIVIDIPRKHGGHFSVDALENIKNGLICNTKYETGTRVFNRPHIFVFANAEPEGIDEMSGDKWIINRIE